MEDRNLSSLCADPASYCTLNAHGQTRKPIPRDKQTYLHMVVKILEERKQHWVAAQVIISPFVVEKYPGQTFFASELRCGPCCSCIDDEVTLQRVTNTVHETLDSYGWPVSRIESPNQYVIDHPTDIQPCTVVAKSIFQTYAGSSESLAHHDHAIHSPRPALAQADTGTRHNQGRDIITAAESTAQYTSRPSNSLKRKAAEPRLSSDSNASSAKRLQVARDEEDEKLVSNITGLLRRGMKKMSSEGTINSLPVYLELDNPHICADYFWEFAESIPNLSKRDEWVARHMSACCSLVGIKFSSPMAHQEPGNKGRHNRKNWRCGTEAVNKIVDAMLPTWGVSAYLIYNILAAKGLNLGPIGRLGVRRRDAIVTAIVENLNQLQAPNCTGIGLYNPSTIPQVLFKAHSLDNICSAISLPEATKIHSGGSASLVCSEIVLNSRTCLEFRMDTIWRNSTGVESQSSSQPDRPTNPVLVPNAELSSDPQFNILDTFATVALSQITLSSSEDTVQSINYEDRTDVFAGHETAEQEQLTPQDLFPQMPLPSSFEYRDREELPLFDAIDIQFQSFN